MNGEGLFTFGHLREQDADFGYDASFVRNADGSEVRLVFRMALIDEEDNHNTINLSSDQILDNSWYFLDNHARSKHVKNVYEWRNG